MVRAGLDDLDALQQEIAGALDALAEELLGVGVLEAPAAVRSAADGAAADFVDELRRAVS